MLGEKMERKRKKRKKQNLLPSVVASHYIFTSRQSTNHRVIFHHQLLVYSTLVFSTMTCGARTKRRVRDIGEAGGILQACDISSVNFWERKHCTYFTVTEYDCSQKMSSNEHPRHPDRKEGETCTAVSGLTGIAEAFSYVSLGVIWSGFTESSYSLCIIAMCQMKVWKHCDNVKGVACSGFTKLYSDQKQSCKSINSGLIFNRCSDPGLHSSFLINLPNWFRSWYCSGLFSSVEIKEQNCTSSLQSSLFFSEFWILNPRVWRCY